MIYDDIHAAPIRLTPAWLRQFLRNISASSIPSATPKRTLLKTSLANAKPCRCVWLFTSFTAGQRALTDFPGGFDLRDSSDVRILFLIFFCSTKEMNGKSLCGSDHWPALFLRIQPRKVARALPLGA